MLYVCFGFSDVSLSFTLEKWGPEVAPQRISDAQVKLDHLVTLAKEFGCT